MKRANKSYRIIVDSNVWISFLIGKNLRGLQYHIDSHKIKIITCNEQFCELSEVFKKQKLKKYFTKEQVIEFFELLDESSEIIKIITKSEICRDVKDNYLVSLSIDSKADFIITGDKDLLDLKNIGETIVISYTGFDNLIQK